MRRPMIHAICLMVPLLAVACGGGTRPEPNRAPVASATVQPQAILLGDSVTVGLASIFSDPDGDALTYAAESSAPEVVSVAITGTDMTVAGVSTGTSTVTMTASDPGGLKALQFFDATVSNLGPEVTDDLPGQSMLIGNQVSLDLMDHFSDPDGHSLTYAAESSAPEVASVAISGTDMTVTGVSAGIATLLVTATDPGGLSASQSADVSVHSPDRIVLERLYAETGGEHWRHTDNWLTDAQLGEWHGVTVKDEGRVVQLDLGGNRLTGAIPAELGLLTSLTLLDLDFNYLEGAIPPELGNLTALTVLHLRSNELTGAIPPELGNLTVLTVLTLDSNHLTGAIPPELGNLSKLSALHLWKNELTGAIPSELGNLTALTELELAHNDLSGTVPPELGRLTRLRSLNLRNNKLTGEFPASLVSLTNVQWALWQINASLCAPRTAAFDAWLAGMQGWSGPRCANASAKHARDPAPLSPPRDAPRRNRR